MYTLTYYTAEICKYMYNVNKTNKKLVIKAPKFHDLEYLLQLVFTYKKNMYHLI